MEKVSLLMKDSSEGDSQKETMIDFILSSMSNCDIDNISVMVNSTYPLSIL